MAVNLQELILLSYKRKSEVENALCEAKAEFENAAFGEPENQERLQHLLNVITYLTAELALRS